MRDPDDLPSPEDMPGTTAFNRARSDEEFDRYLDALPDTATRPESAILGSEVMMT